MSTHHHNSFQNKNSEDINKKVNTNETTAFKPKKLDSSILDRIEKKESINNSIKITPQQKRNVLKELEQQEIERIEKLTTINKIIKLQKLLKEMISMKKRFETIKTNIIDKINKNCFNFYKNKIGIKEIYDYCQSKKPEENTSYTLVKDSKQFFQDINRDIYDDVYNFLFFIRNNNKIMLQLIDKCDIKDYEELCVFLTNFCYEDTINSSFIQEELMLLIYLIFEKNIYEKLPEQIKNTDNEFSFSIFRNKENIIYYILRSLSRKADIRNFLCSILVDSITKLQEDRKHLLSNFFYPNNSEEEKSDIEEDDDFGNISTRLTMRSEVVSQLKLTIEPNSKINRTASNKNAKLSPKILKIINQNTNLENVNNDKDKEDNLIIISDDIPEEDLDKNDLDPFFKENNVSLSFIQDKLKEYEHISKNNLVNLAIKEYLNSLINDINESQEEIYSNKMMINYIKSLKNKKETNENNNEESFDKIIEVIKKNYNAITEIIDDILNKLKENITSVPVIIKCISNIIEQLLNKKYIEKKSESLLNIFQKYSFKLNFLIGNILLTSLINPDYNGIFTSDLLSNNTSKNLKIVYNILDKFLSGKLFINSFDSLFNKYIIEMVPKMLEIIDNIEKNFKLPDVLQNLVNTCTDINNEKRLKDFEYNYFYEKEENIQYQSICFNVDILTLLIDLARKIEDKIEKEEEIEIFAKVLSYSNCLNDIIKKNNINRKSEFIHLVKINYNSKIESKINLILKDNFVGLGQIQNINSITYFKKCITEVLAYVNIIDKMNFIFFTNNMKELIHNNDIKNLIYKRNLNLEYDYIINNKTKNEIDKNAEEEKYHNFGDVLLPKIMEYLKYEIGNNLEDPKNQRVIFCMLYIQTHLNDIPQDYIENNYYKLFMELIKETLVILNYLNSNILNQLYNKIKEGNKLNLIITSNYMQIKSLEKFKCIEYLYSKLLIPNKFKIQKDKDNNITKIEYEKEVEKKKEKKKKQEDNPFLNDFVVINNEPVKVEEKPKVKSELIKKFIDIIPDFKKYEKSCDDIIKMEENCGLPVALKNFFKCLKDKVKHEKIIKRFTKEDVESISTELENFILFKLYDKLYPSKSSKEDIKFYKKCCRLNFIKPENIISDKNIYNEKLWKISIDYLNEIDNKYTPQNKIKTVLKSFNILQNSIAFCSGKKELGVDDTIKPLIYVLIKSKPKNIFSNYNFAQLYINENLSKTQYGILLTQILMIMRIIKDMKYNELIGVTEEEFGKDEDNI